MQIVKYYCNLCAKEVFSSWCWQLNWSPWLEGIYTYSFYVLFLLQANCFSPDNADICNFVHLMMVRIKLLEMSIWISQTENCKEWQDLPMCISYDSACNYRIKKVTVEWFCDRTYDITCFLSFLYVCKIRTSHYYCQQGLGGEWRKIQNCDKKENLLLESQKNSPSFCLRLALLQYFHVHSVMLMWVQEPRDRKCK